MKAQIQQATIILSSIVEEHMVLTYREILRVVFEETTKIHTLTLNREQIQITKVFHTQY